jgi:hypothetical protein
MKMIIHVGPMKTGSTSIQQFLDWNRSALENKGILYPNGLLFQNCHHELPNLIKGTIQRFSSFNNKGELSLDLILKNYVSDAVEKKLDTILVSSEDFVGLSGVEFQDLIKRINRIRKCDIELIYFDFDPKTRSKSMENQYIRSGEYLDSIAKQKIFDSMSLIKADFESATKDLGVNVKIINYESVGKEIQIFRKILEACTDSNFQFKEEEWRFPDYLLNKSTADSYTQQLNEFNKFNVGSREFDPTAPIIFTENFPLENSRFFMHFNIISKLVELDNAVLDRDNAILQRDNAILQRDNAILQRDNAILDRDNAILQRDNAILDRDNAILDRDNAILDRDNAILDRDIILASRIWRIMNPYRNLKNQISRRY